MMTSRSIFLQVSRGLGCILLATTLSAQIITTTAGGFVGDGGDATQAALAFPRFVAQDSNGNIYITDAENHRIRKVSNGVITTIAGTGISGFSGDGGLAKNAQISYPVGIALDSAGNMIFADSGNNRIRKIDTTGTISTIAGIGLAGFSGDGGPAIAAELSTPFGLALDTVGNLFFSDTGNERIRRIDTAGVITTVAGNGSTGYNGDNIAATSASLNVPRGVVLDSAGNLYIADTVNFRVRKVDVFGIITTFAGTGVQGFSGDGGPAIDADVGRPRGVIIRGNQLLIANSGQAHIRTVGFTSGIINSLVGLTIGFNGDGTPLGTDFDGPTGMFLTSTGALLVSDEFNQRVRSVTSSSVTTIAGGFIGDNRLGTLGDFMADENMAFDSAGNCFVADAGSHRIRKVDTAGQITTVAGNGLSGYTGDGGSATQAELNFPYGVTVDSAGNLYIADTGNLVIRKVDTQGTINTYATDPSFNDLLTLAIDSAGNLYAADDASCVVHKIALNGVVSIVAGELGLCGYNGDGIPATSAMLNGPYGLALDTKGNLYLGDYGNNRVRKVSRAGVITTIAGNGTCGFSGDGGSATAAMICSPMGVGVDSRGNVYFGDYLNYRVRKISGGKINTVAGTGLLGYNGNSLPARSTNIGGPITVGFDNVGNLFVLDDESLRLRKVH